MSDQPVILGANGQPVKKPMTPEEIAVTIRHSRCNRQASMYLQVMAREKWPVLDVAIVATMMLGAVRRELKELKHEEGWENIKKAVVAEINS